MNSSQSKMSLMGWLGRQFGHVKKAIQAPLDSKPLYRQQKIEEASLPNKPELKLRRTTIDEVIVNDNKAD